MRQLFQYHQQQKGTTLVIAVILFLIGTLGAMAYLSAAFSEAQNVDMAIENTQIKLFSEMGLDFQDVVINGIMGGKLKGTTKHKIERRNPLTRRKETLGAFVIKYDDAVGDHGMATLTSSAVGVDERGRPMRDHDEYGRKMEANVIRRTFAQYLYFSDTEQNPDNLTPVRFYWADVLDGLVHSNDVITINTRFSPSPTMPTFYEKVTSCEDHFSWWTPPDGPEDANFLGGYELEVPAIIYPHNADNIRRNAMMTWQPRWTDPESGEVEEVAILLDFQSNGTVRVIKQRFRIPDNPDSYHPDITYGAIVDTIYTALGVPRWPAGGSFFIDGVVAVKGRVRGNISVGASHNIFIVNDLFYADSNAEGEMGVRGKPTEYCRNYLGLISERRVMIGNSHANRTDNWGIVINAAIAALGDGTSPGTRGSFGVQHKRRNELDEARFSSMEPWMDEPPVGSNGETSHLTFWGSIAQRYRGIVHTTDTVQSPPPDTHGGYHIKDYHFDQRFWTQSPPDYIEVELEGGGALYTLLNWHETTGVN